MTNPIRLTSKLLVSPQIQIVDISALNAVGIQTIVCNRPDGESADQPSAHELASAAKQLGMTFLHLPIGPKMQMKTSDAEQFADILDNAAGEVLAYCRTGNRSAAIWALSQRGKLSGEEIINAATQSGFDLKALEPMLAE